MRGGRPWSRGREEKPKGYPIRIGQLFGAYCVGSIYPCDSNTTVMVAGLDAFRPDSMREVHDTRLAKHVGVSRLLLPPQYDSSSREIVPAVRFPGWLYCPRCGRMQHVSPGNTSTSIECNNPDCKKGRHGAKLVPERFVVACPNGHIDDFPIMEWVHGSDGSYGKGHTITRKTGGGSATLSDIRYSCSCGAKRTLNGASDSNALTRIGYSCHGRQPWLDRLDPRGCTTDAGELRVVQMGGTNVCYADVVSSVLIPDSLDEDVKSIVNDNLPDIKEMEEAGKLDFFISFLAKSNGMDPDALMLAYQRTKTEGAEAASEGDYLHEEYLTLRNPKQQKKGSFVGALVDVGEYDSPLMGDFFQRIALIDTITVTRALVGFSRLNPEANDSMRMRDRRRILSRTPKDWTLAIQTTGEGIFLELDGSTLDEWRERRSVTKRFDEMQRHLDESQARRKLGPRTLNPDYVLIHTLAHLLILGISEVCGYTAASLRERIYCDKFLDDENGLHDDMHGLLIYTASDNSDGSLGGLVRSGRPGRFEEILHDALQKALWCSGDPVCIESHGQGLDSCNLAACYNCALVPETSCETGNRFLDRGLLVGTLDDPSVGLMGRELRGFGGE